MRTPALPYLGGEVRRTVLPSGLRVVTEQIPHMHSFAVGFFVGVGSVLETPERNGASHFLEHVLFKGTRRRRPEEISAAIESVGGDLNAYTTKEYTCFYSRVLSRDADLAVDVLADMITSSRIRAADVQSERAVILDEIAMHADDPVESVQELVTTRLLPSPGLGAPVIGTEDSVIALSRDQIVRHWQRNYHPGSVVVSAGGDVDHDRLVRQLSALGSFGAPATRPRSPVGSAPATGPDLVVDRRPFEQSTASYAFPGPGLFDPERFPAGLLSVVLGGGMSSRLFLEVRERRGLAYAIEAGETNYSDQGLWSVDWQCAPDRVADILDLVRGELEKIAADGVSEPEVQRAKGQLRGQTVLSYESPQSRMGRLGTAEMTGDQHTVSELLDGYDRVTPADVQQMAARLLGRPAVLGLVGPRRPTKRLERSINHA